MREKVHKPSTSPTLPCAMAFPVGIEPIALDQFENKHRNFTQVLKPGASFHLVNPHLESPWKEYKATTANFQWLIAAAIRNSWRLRALGRGWSLSKVAVTEGGLIDTMDLRNCFNVKADMAHPDMVATGRVENLLLAQCGLSMFALNNKLEKEGRPRRCIRASGAANGQSIVGAFSTNTHGAAWNFGSPQDQITGLHLITGPDSHVWLERASSPVVSDKFIRSLGAELKRDDALFNAALVSFGSFGFIHGVMVEGQPICLLQEFKKQNVAYDAAMRECLTTLDFDKIKDRMPGPYKKKGHELYHFEVGFNPHRFAKDDPEKGLFLRVLYKTAYREDYERLAPSPKFQYGENTFGVLQTILDHLGPASELLIPGLVNALYPLAYQEGMPREGTFGEHFGTTRVRGKASSFAIGMDMKDCATVMEMVVDANRTDPFPGVTAMRFVKGTAATLGFTRFERTCVMELDAMDCNAARTFHQLILHRMETAGIAYTLHWGKVNSMIDRARLDRMYGPSVADWKKARTTLLAPEVMEVFNNQFMERCGLHEASAVA